MKLRVLISLLFVVATTLSVLHELEHIKGGNSSSTCLVCSVSHNFLSADTSKADISFDLVYTKEIITNPKIFVFSFKKTDNHSNAPPYIS